MTPRLVGALEWAEMGVPVIACKGKNPGGQRCGRVIGERCPTAMGENPPMEPARPRDALARTEYSLANFNQILFPCLDAVTPASVVEVGAFRGEFTRELLAWAAGADASITAIEPEPPPELLELSNVTPSWSWSESRAARRWVGCRSRTP